ncbi:MAG: class I SAM-dependent methyltransferase [Leptonema sp. (in: bacteria)]
MNCPHTNSPLLKWEHSSDFLIEPKTKVLYFEKWQPLQYDEDYFLKEYKNSYKKTYLEDEQNLRNLAKRRLKNLKRFIKSSYSILEIGCATGFFLDEAKKYFSSSLGIEISSFAVEYAKKRFKLNIEKIDFMQFIQSNTKTFDVIASFYVIEHFKEQKEIFSFISKSLNQKGLWICAVPSTYGPLFEFDTFQWIQRHPIDHFVDYNPKALKKIVKLYKLNIIDIKPASYHQERAKGFLKLIPPKIYKFYSNIFTYGDTLEFIAQKT